ncbi:NAD(P)-dependent oxidoreductase [Metapseudomonas lalkuanensis]|uniref:NAD-dependent epimerase/dehydratase family protein n=1 Tax=Metapseudomonas lalkuanensis TaxID=2604832 RepID=UPI001CF1B007|nr:NAD(P)-dependent oxidoreductase [Pseudomonas lalkuanensis]UCP00018.1 NAD(P)-dependent oxidoreductase [Pseudomonas lalkuanensis]
MIDVISAKKKIVCVTGASGFIGSHLMLLLAGSHEFEVRTLRRKLPEIRHQGERVFLGDLTEPETLSSFLMGADVVIHLAQPAWGSEGNIGLSDCAEFANACRIANIRRLIYVSTATVVGNTSEVVVNESTPCLPASKYERQKFDCELTLREGLGPSIDLGILRPTAVFGSNGQNLLKLAKVVLESSIWHRNALRFLHGKRRMHLVSAENVVASIMFLATCERSLGGNVFILSDDADEKNQYQSVDRIMANAAGKRGIVLDLAAPAWLLRLMLTAMGRSQANPSLRYDCSKIESWGFRRELNLEKAIEDFMRWYIKNQGGRE